MKVFHWSLYMNRLCDCKRYFFAQHAITKRVFVRIYKIFIFLFVFSCPTMSPVMENVNMESFKDSVNAESSKPSESDMKFYYLRLLPFRYIFQWLSHSPKPTKDFTMREFAYEYRSKIYQRYNSFGTLEEFKKSVVTANPTRFEIGAVYKINPKERKTYQNKHLSLKVRSSF